MPGLTEGSGLSYPNLLMHRSASGASDVSHTSLFAYGSGSAHESPVESMSSRGPGQASTNSSFRHASRQGPEMHDSVSADGHNAMLRDYEADDHLEAGIALPPLKRFDDKGLYRHPKSPMKNGGAESPYYPFHQTHSQKRAIQYEPFWKKQRRCLPFLRFSRREALIAISSCFLTLFCLLYGVALHRLATVSEGHSSDTPLLSSNNLGAQDRLGGSQLRTLDLIRQSQRDPEPIAVAFTDVPKQVEEHKVLLSTPTSDEGSADIIKDFDVLGVANGNVLVVNETMPSTKVLAHIPGWTILENVYMYDGALLIISEESEDKFPERRMMTCSGLPMDSTPEYLEVWTREKAEMYFGDRIFPVPGFTYLWNDPKQHLGHYYHFVGEVWLGSWRMYSAWAPRWLQATADGTIPDPDRIVMPHTEAREWRDGPNLNSYFLRASFPNIHIEAKDIWEARSKLTKGRPGERNLTDSSIKVPGTAKVWRFDRILLASRSAAFRGLIPDRFIHRTAGSAFYLTKGMDTVREFGEWWSPLRKRVVRFAGQSEKMIDYAVYPSYTREHGAMIGNGGGHEDGNSHMPVVITYLSRQNAKRHLLPEDHTALVAALTTLCEEKKWEFVLFEAELMTLDEQLLLASRTTVLVGVHGNGLTHLLAMPPTPRSAVIEIFYPTGFSHDYQWTAEAVGLKHYAIWNNTVHTSPNLPWVNYPDGFQGQKIPVYAPAVINLIEEKVNGKRPSAEYPMPCEENDCDPRVWLAKKE